MSLGTDEAANRQTNGTQVLVWDLLVRVGHWLLVVLFFVAYFTEDDLLTIHSWAGYGVGIYLIVRIVWGFVGPKHARFSDFAYGPTRAAQYLKDLIFFQSKRYLGHTPAGALMIFTLLICLALTTVTGVALLAVEENAGPLAPWLGRAAAVEKTLPDLPLFTVPARASDDEEERNDEERDDEHEEDNDEDGAEALEEIHEFISNLTLFLVLLHIVGVTLTSIIHRENLVRAMITGYKRTESIS
ncbi:MAG: cytochrome b/b6 domain-containing protein [Rhodospirillales bacterium]|nr:cytochrome b/b6 domain-containing protein [Rhodospirillales bacterium]MDH3790862.1 cytochrome b/b6 domain-containing protein [Rhodospirillales bacterium]MDH3970041.1 cytochrome b/b6 domain-containing protein [Rhodospirillales bacterium]